MNCLLIDIGNTHLKWGLDSDSVFTFGGKCKCQPGLDGPLFFKQLEELQPGGVFISSVGDEVIKQQVCDLARAQWGITAETLVSPAKECGISNAYPAAERLGSDRWAAMVAAFEQAKGPVCVVDSGTAVTLDAVNIEGLHLGGLIVPGFGLMPSCLQQGSCIEFQNEQLPFTEAGLGRSTDACIQQGSSMAISGMVNTVFAKLKIDLAGISLILTGGDADTLQRQLGYQSSIDPHLVLKGLAIIHRSRMMVSEL